MGELRGRGRPPGRPALVRGAAQGQEPAWRALVDNFAGLVWSVIRGYRLNPADAADVSQTTWLRLAEHIASLRQPERVGAWLVTTAGRECLVKLGPGCLEGGLHLVPPVLAGPLQQL